MKALKYILLNLFFLGLALPARAHAKAPGECRNVAGAAAEKESDKTLDADGTYQGSILHYQDKYNESYRVWISDEVEPSEWQVDVKIIRADHLKPKCVVSLIQVLWDSDAPDFDITEPGTEK